MFRGISRWWTLGVIAGCALPISLAACSGGSHIMPLAGGRPQSIQRTADLTVARSFTSNTWTMGAPDPLKRLGAAAAVVGSKIYVLGGVSAQGTVGKNDIYDTATNTWSTGAAMPTKRTGLAAAGLNGIVYAIGGFGSTNNVIAVVEAYDPTTNKWTTKAPLPTTEYVMEATVLNNMIFVVGGFNGASRVATVYEYDPSSNSWSNAPSLIVAKQSAYVGTVGTDIVAAGGFTNAEKTTSDNELFKSGGTSWKARRLMPSNRYGGCAAGINGFLYAAGGAKSASATANAQTRLDGYDVATDTWASLAPMPIAALYTASATVNGLLYCFDGTNTNNPKRQIFGYTQIYTP
jgi:N-acetylneuraminic acid mutarotase